MEAGIIAEGAFPKEAIPAGRLNTPAPTILFTKLNVRLAMDASPPFVEEDSSFGRGESSSMSIDADAAAMMIPLLSFLQEDVGDNDKNP